MSIKEKLESLGRNSIQLKIARKETYKLSATRFGGKPDVPPDFVWPTYEGESYDHVVKDRPLTFLAQFNCAELAQFDKEHLLPDHGLLPPSSMKRIPSAGAMTPRIRVAPASIGLRIFRRCPQQTSRRIWEKISSFQWSRSRWMPKSPILPGRISARCSQMKRMTTLNDALDELTGEDPEDPEDCSQLLGWPDVIQNSMFDECDLVSQGYRLGNPENWHQYPQGYPPTGGRNGP